MEKNGIRPWHLALLGAAVLALAAAGISSMVGAANDPMNNAVADDKSADLAGLDPNSEAYIKEMEK